MRAVDITKVDPAVRRQFRSVQEDGKFIEDAAQRFLDFAHEAGDHNDKLADNNIEFLDLALKDLNEQVADIDKAKQVNAQINAFE